MTTSETIPFIPVSLLIGFLGTGAGNRQIVSAFYPCLGARTVVTEIPQAANHERFRKMFSVFST